MANNNYVRLDRHPDLKLMFFNSHNAQDIERVRTWVAETRVGRMPIALWKPCAGLGYPVVGYSSGSYAIFTEGQPSPLN